MLNGILIKIFCLVVICCVTSDAVEPTEYQYGLLKIFLGDPILQQDGKEFCITYPNQYFGLPETPTTYFKLHNATGINACDDNLPGPLPVTMGTLLLMMSTPNCTLMSYVNYTRSVSASGLVLISDTKRIVSQNFSLDIVAIISNSTADDIFAFWTNKGSDAEVQVYSPVDSDFEGSIMLLWLVACLCVAIGSLTGGSYQDLHSTSRQQILDGSDGQQEPKNVQINFSVTLVLTLVMFISGTLLLLYFFYSYLVYFFMVVFCIASGRATYDILSQVLNTCKLDEIMPRIKNCGIHQIVIAGLCTVLPITWFVLRHDPYIWILQDILGVCFCVHLIQTLRIPNLKICTVLLSLLFVYDIFFVFITPFFTSDGKSVMVEVATGGDSEESLPLLIKFPHLKQGALAACATAGYSLLGFGDIIVPGFLVCFANAFDIVRGNRRRPYFITAMIGYAVGLCIAFIALYLSQTGQPALLYIVPTTLIPIYIVGICKKDVHNLWLGTISITEVEP